MMDPRFEVFKGAHPLVEVLMMLARSRSSKRREVAGDVEGERTRSSGRCEAGLDISVGGGIV